MVSESEKEKIRKEARRILDKFAKTLEKVPAVKAKEEESESFREELEGSEADSDFRKKMFENAPNKDDDCIIAEKANW